MNKVVSVDNGDIEKQLQQIQAGVGDDPIVALDQLSELLEQSEQSTVVWMMMGSSCLEAKNYPKAAKAFQHILDEDPKNELASSGLFHSLWKQDDTIAALEEIKRYFIEFGPEHDTKIAHDHRAAVGEIRQRMQQQAKK